MKRISAYCPLCLAGLAVFLGLASALPAQETPISPPEQQEPGAPPTPPAGSEKPIDSRRSSDSPSGGPGEPVNSKSYKIGPADVLSIRVWNEQQFSGASTVHQDGMFTLPLVGDLKAGGQTPSEVEAEITKALAKYVRSPLVTVTVQQVGSKRYYMDGMIARPGEYPLVVPTTILEAISKAGGLQAFGNGKKIYVLRGANRIRFNYKDVLHGKKMGQNVELQPGDHVVVP